MEKGSMEKKLKELPHNTQDGQCGDAPTTFAQG